MKITLVSGLGELFGAELALGVEYSFSMCKQSIFTYHGCTLSVAGDCLHVYVAEDTQMALYLNLHLALEGLRTQAAASGSRGPRVLVVGPMDVGKSSCCRILLNYAFRHGRRVTYVDLDVGVGSISIPGTLCAATVERLLDAQTAYDSLVPLVYYYGHTSPSENSKLYMTLLSSLARQVVGKLDVDADAQASGVIINTCGFTEGIGYQAIVHAVHAFQVDTILVLGDERLHSELQRDFQNSQGSDPQQQSPPVNIIRLTRSGGSVNRDSRFRKQQRNGSIRAYFYGRDGELYPRRATIPFSDLSLFHNGQANVAPSTALPIGKTRKIDETKCLPLTPSADLLHRVISVSSTTNTDELIGAPSQGFLFVDEVDIAKSRISVLAPVNGRIPKQPLLVGSLKWID